MKNLRHALFLLCFSVMAPFVLGCGHSSNGSDVAAVDSAAKMGGWTVTRIVPAEGTTLGKSFNFVVSRWKEVPTGGKSGLMALSVETCYFQSHRNRAATQTGGCDTEITRRVAPQQAQS